MANCVDCGEPLGVPGGNSGRCAFCHVSHVSEEMRLNRSKNPENIHRELAPKKDIEKAHREGGEAVLLTTEPTLSDIVERKGIVTAEVFLGANQFRDMGQEIRADVDGRFGGGHKALRDLREHALRELQEEARGVGANAVVAVDLDYSEISGTGAGKMLFLVASGTAVTLN